MQRRTNFLHSQSGVLASFAFMSIIRILMVQRNSSAPGTSAWKTAVQSLQKKLEAGKDVSVSRGQDLIRQERELRERIRLRQRAQEIWLRLSVKERNAIRANVREKNSLYRDADNSFIESACIGLIRDQLQSEHVVLK